MNLFIVIIIFVFFMSVKLISFPLKTEDRSWEDYHGNAAVNKMIIDVCFNIPLSRLKNTECNKI